MLNRRSVLLSGVAGAAVASLNTPLAHAAFMTQSAPAAAQLNKLFDDFMSVNLDRSPEGTTALGLDSGARAAEKSKLDGRSLADIQENKRIVTDQLKRLKALDPAPLSDMDRINYDVVLFGLQTGDEADRRYEYGGGGAGTPYVVSQLTGAYDSIPDFLDSQHRIANKADADAYLSRLAAFAVAMDQEVEVVRHDAGLGTVPPDFSLTRTLGQMTSLRDVAPDQSVLVSSVVRRTREKNIPGDYAGNAKKILVEKFYPALDRQIALVKELQAHATHDAGVWKLKDGESYYADSLTFWTTSTMSPAEIHRTGLELVKDFRPASTPS
jgi:uncharacterized protein (DUF885 family)